MSVKGTIERYKKACSDAVNPPTVTEANTKYYQQEASKLRRQIRDIQNSNRIVRHIVGESLGSLNFKELKNLEGRLEKGISRVRSKKFHRSYMNLFQSELLVAEIEYMQKRSQHYIPVNLLEPNQQFSGQDQPPLQLV
ncbi:hypothetical protein HID58_035693 [Brassica napus]|uniref:K-box domain-containing protein n=1 Tax=Brassica napus TaxID=3708 RepID=A0ABQ8C5M8_BRANA|nr:hypothetical protein HID58_035693 [Brassica napus]